MKPSRHRHIKHQRFLRRRVVKRARCLARRRKTGAVRPLQRRQHSKVSAKAECILYAPAKITLRGKKAHAELTGFLAELRRAFAHHSRDLCIDFSQTTNVFPEGMLLFYAELDRLVSIFTEKKARCIPASHNTVDGVLQHLGIYQLLRHNSLLTPQGHNVVGWKVHHAQQVDGTIFGPPLEALKLKTDLSRKLYEGVSEAVTNVLHHAHLLPRKDGLNLPVRDEWWMFIHESESKLYVAVCDLGIGIPRSLPLQHTWEAIMHATRVIFGQRRRTDGRLIQAALRLRRSRTEASHRGMGFSDMIAALNTMPESRMMIHSNHGVLTYNASTQPPAIDVMSFKSSVLGTIIAWHFPNEGNTDVH